MAPVLGESDLQELLKRRAATLARHLGEFAVWRRRREADIDSGLQRDLARVRQSRDAAIRAIQIEDANAAERLTRELASVESGAGLWAAPWGDPRWTNLPPATARPSVLRIGTLTAALRMGQARSPALFRFAGGRGLLIAPSPDHHEAAVLGVQSLLLRLLLISPPGSLRLLLIDPLGLGQNVAVYSNLLETAPETIFGRIWVERRDIEQQLAEQSAHLETVIRTYLRGHFHSLEDYNAEHHEVAEPYRLIVALDFPTNFSEDALQRMLSLVVKGPPCGVFAVLVAGPGPVWPHGWSREDFERVMEVIRDDAWDDPELAGTTLVLDRPPPAATFEALVKQVGQAIQAAERRKLPFRTIEPDQSQWWQRQARTALSAPIGLAGASRFEFCVGHAGTGAHAMLAGRTGMGKSTFLHTLITSLALSYPPEELELYLLDFKGGVEFKHYATWALPHARVVAIASVREFGLSVLEGLLSELDRRYDLIRGVECRDLTLYRDYLDRTGGPPLPRILLIADEFQHFFAEDDELADRAAMALDRLVKMGRGLGIHVLLATQTLTSAFPRLGGMLDQMAVRVALACSDKDSRLILGEDNPGARLLSRPGEAFYYDPDSGRKENTKVRVAWLDEDSHQRLLRELRERAEVRPGLAHRPRIFEGDALARLEDSEGHPLHSLLVADGWPSPSDRTRVWLGEPLAMADSTWIEMGRMAGRNLLAIGRDAAAMRGAFWAATMSLLAQHAPDRAELWIADLDPVPGGATDELAALAETLPHTVRRLGPRALGDALADLSGIVAARGQDSQPSWPIIWLVLLGLHRAKRLRRDEDEGYLRENPETAPAEHLARVLRDGPEVGVHVLAWSESLKSAQLVLDRKSMRECGIRLATALPEEDSRQLFDESAGTKLRPHEAALWDEERAGALEKFRPYASPSSAWLASWTERLRSRAGSRGVAPAG